MNKRTCIFFLLLILSSRLASQILPKEGSRLNYRIAGFSFEAKKQKGISKIEIAEGTYTAKGPFSKKIIKTVEVKGNKVIVELPYFGEEYTWRIVSLNGGSSEFHHFSTGFCPAIDSNNLRLRVLSPATAYKDAYVFLDNSKVLYDMDGKPVWYLPDSNEYTDNINDLKLSAEGTITFLLTRGAAYEINYNGDILWRGPRNNPGGAPEQEHYHHEFTRLSNGHYMALGIEKIYVLKKRPAANETNFVMPDSIVKKNAPDDSNYAETECETIIEYDKKGEMVWSWKLSDYYKTSDLWYYVKPDSRAYFDMRENAFFFDEKNENIYLSLKTPSRILKIQYPTGKVVKAYGEIFKPGIPQMNNGLFYGQHACKQTNEGYLLLYNNNMRDSASFPEVLVLQEPASEMDTLKKVWQYNCTRGDIATNIQSWRTQQTGGNVMELPDHSVFVSMSGDYNKIFIVNKDKKVLWSATPEKRKADGSGWRANPEYRASIIVNRAALERLVWGQEAAGR